MKNHGKLLECAALAAMAVTVLFSILGFSDTCGRIRTQVLRLHVIANSDSDADQRLKLAVRDAILAESGALFAEAENKAAALTAAKQALPALKKTAQAIVAQAGAPYAVRVELAQSMFPTRTYENVTFPAGSYDAVKITLGRGAGRNWWCVMFPSLCLPAAGNAPLPQDVLDADALALISKEPKVELRFWIVDFFAGLSAQDPALKKK